MGVKTTLREYTSPLKPFSQKTTWLNGNVGDWQKLTLEAEFSVFKQLSQQETVTLTEPNVITLNNGQTWNELGFDLGMTVSLEFNVFSISGSTNNYDHFDFDLDIINGSTAEVSNIHIGGFPDTAWKWFYGAIIPNRSGTDEVKNVYLYSDVRPQGIQLDIAHVSNASAPSGVMASHIDGTKTSLKMKDTDTMSLAAPGVAPYPFTYQLDFKSGMALVSGTVEYIGTALHLQCPTYTYKIELIYMICPFFDDINNLINNIAPDAVKGKNAITDLFQIKGFPTYNNPNVTISTDPKISFKLGNTGWFDENFNQLPNPFTFTPVVYKNDSGTTVSQLDYSNPVTVTTTISGLTNFANATFSYGFIWIPIDEDVYKENEFHFHENCKISTGGQAAAMTDYFNINTNNSPYPSLRYGYSTDGASMDASDISFFQNGADIDVSITFRPNAAFSTFMDALGDTERKYVLWVSIGDPAPDNNKTDRVSLKLDFNGLETYIEPIGAFDGLTIDFLDHPQDSTDTPTLCGNSIYVEDDLLAKVSFQIDTAASAIIPIPTGISFGFVAQRNSDSFQYVLDNNTVDLTVFPDPTQFNFDTSRGFKLGTGNTKNWWKVEYDATNDSGTLLGVLGWYGYKIRWEDWLKRLNVPIAFYDNTEGQNGLNNDWFHYFNTAGWTLQFFVNIDATLNGTAVRYQNLKNLTVLDYDSNTTISTTLKYYRTDPVTGLKGAQLIGGTDPISGTPLGVILANEIVFLDIEYTSTVAVWVDQPTVDADTYATQCIEVANGAGQKEFRQLSSIWASEFDNPMIPLTGETLAKVTFVSTTKLLVETRIDANKLTDASRYKITGREGCK